MSEKAQSLDSDRCRSNLWVYSLVTLSLGVQKHKVDMKGIMSRQIIAYDTKTIKNLMPWILGKKRIFFHLKALPNNLVKGRVYAIITIVFSMLHRVCSFNNTNNRIWRDCSVIKSACCSSRRPEFCSKHLGQEAYSIPAIVTLMPSTGLYRHAHS